MADSTEHAHGHGHAHGHAHVGNVASRNQDSPLERGAGRGKLLFIDAPSGIAGDMTIGALLDLGVPWAVMEQILAELGVHGMILLTNTKHALVGLEGYDLSIVGERPIGPV